MKYRNRVLTFLFFLSLITFIDRASISVAGPQMQADLGLTPERWGWVLGVFSLAYAAFEIPSGILGDRLGARRVLTRIVLWWSAFTALTGAAGNFATLLGTRFAFGVGEAGAFPNASASIRRWFPAGERGKAQGLIWMATRLGAALSPLLVVPIQSRWGWRTSFFLFGVLGVIWAAAWHRWYRDDPREVKGIGAEELSELAVLDGSRHARPRLRWSKNLLSIMLMYFCYCYAAYFFISWMPTYLVKGKGFTSKELAVFATFPFVAGALANLAGGITSDRLVRRWGARKGRMWIGAGGLAASALSVFGAVVSHGKVAPILWLTLAYASSDFMLPSAWAVCLDVGRESSGAVTGIMNTAGQFGSFVSSVMFGYLVTTFHSYDLPLVPISAMLLLSATLWLVIDPAAQGTSEIDSRLSYADSKT